MPSTRQQVRNAVRRRLEDTGGSPLWDDLALNEGIAAAMLTYGERFPLTATQTVVTAAAGFVWTLPTPIRQGAAVEVRRPAVSGPGIVVPRRWSVSASGLQPHNPALEWWVAKGTHLHVTRPLTAAEAGTWEVDYLGPRLVAPDDVTPLDLEPDDDRIIIALTCAYALDLRATAEAKRNNDVRSLRQQQATAAQEAEDLMAWRKRRARGGFLSTV